MSFIEMLVERILKLNRRMRRWQRVVSVLSAVVVFASTYALVLPAITLDKETASAQAGIEAAASVNEAGESGTVYESEPEEPAEEEIAEEDSIEEVIAEEPAEEELAAEQQEEDSSSEGEIEEADPQSEEEESAEEAASEEGSSETADTEENEAAPAQDAEEETADAASEEEPADPAEQPDEGIALITEHTQLVFEDAEGEYIVYAEFDEDAKLPVGVQLQVKEITEESDPEAYAMYYEKALSGVQDKYDENTELSFAKFYDIAFVYEGVEYEPAAKVNVKIEYKEAVKIQTDTTVDTIHFDKNNEEEPEIIESEIDSEKKGKEDAVKTVEFKSDQFSVYGIVGTELVTEITLPGSDDTYEVHVTYGSDAMIPDNATLDVSSIEKGSAAYEKAKEEIINDKKEKDAGFNEATFKMAALDITILDENGKPVEPAEDAEVKVSIKMKEIPADASENAMYNTMEVQHLNTSKGETVVETVAGVADVKVADGTASAEFTIDSFSTFALTWTDGSATVHWGTINDDGSFNEFDAASLDTSVGSIELRASYSGYEYSDAVYYATEPDTVSINVAEAVEGRTFINDVIKKASDGENYTWTAEDAQNAAAPFTIADGSHIYAVYKLPDPDHPHGQTPAQHDDIPTPTTNKHVSTNLNPDGTPDGTYTIELDITGAQITETQQKGANVILVFDDSVSMQESVGNRTRLAVAKDAMATLVNTLNPGTNDIQMALIHFGVNSTKHTFAGSNWTRTGSDITSAVNNLTGQQYGTNWHEALQHAYQIAAAAPDDDPTYIIFITDGCPSVNSFSNNSDSHGSAGTNNTTDPCYLGGLGYAKAIAGTKGITYSTTATWTTGNWWNQQTYSETITEIGLGDFLYGIYTGTDTNNMLGQLISSSNGSGVITATSESAINAAFKNIAETIVNNLGATGVTTTDGVTELSSVSADVHGAAGAFEYYRKGGKNEDGTEKYSSTANDGLGETWSDAPGAIYNDDGSVTWDLSSIGQTEAEVTYVVRFKVWPSQEAYDIIANLNNGVVDYDDLDPEVQLQIYESSGKYYLKTNTNLNTSYTFQGTTYTDPITFEQGQMVLNETQMNVRKAFADTINSEDPFTSIIFYLKMTNPEDKGTAKEGTFYYYQTDGSLNEELVTSGDVKAKELPVNTGNNWQNSIYIAPGIIEGTEVLETGHKYTLEEKIITGSEYEYEFTPQTVRPMIINGSLTYLVLVDEYNAPGKNNVPADAQTYTVDDETYYVASTNDGELVGTNRKTAELDITKIVETNGILTDDEEGEESFTYRVTLQIPDDNSIDPAGIVGYEYVNRTQSNAFYAYGYHTYTQAEWEALGNEGEPPVANAYSEDIDRLGNNTYRRWQYLIYRDLLANGGWTTVNGKVKLVRDNDGNIQWRNPAVGGYHTVTYDMTLKQSEIIRFSNLPSGTVYTIQEIYANKYVADNSGNSSGLAPVSDASNIAAEGYAVTVKSTGGTVSQTAVANDTVSGTISGLDTRYYNQFTNTMTKTVDVNLAGTKKLDGYEWSEESYHFTLATTGSNPMPAEATGKTEFDLTAASGNADQTDTFGRLRFTSAGTYTYTVSETNAGTLQVVNGKAVQFGNAVTVTIVIAEDENTHELSVSSVTGTGVTWNADTKTATATIINTAPTTTATATKAWLNADETTTPPTGAKVTFALYADGEATGDTVELDGTVDENGETAEWVATFSGLQQYKIVNDEAVLINYTIGESVKWTGYDLVVPAGTTEPYTVASGGTLTNQQSTSWVQFVKKDMGTTTLAGAVFTFNDGNADLTVTSGDDGVLATSGTDSVNKFELAIRNNPYVMTEITAPDGYNKLTDTVNVSVKTTGVSATMGGTTWNYESGDGSENNPYVLVIRNSTGVELPMTGGPGTLLYTLSGIALMLGAALMYGFRLRRRERRFN